MAPTSGEPLDLGLFDPTPDGGVVLRGHRCHVCGTPGFPRRPTCGTCGSEAPDEVELGASGGTLFGWTEVSTAPPGYEGPVPYWFGIVELDDGLRVLGRLVELGDAVAFGQRMVCVADTVGGDTAGGDTLGGDAAGGDTVGSPLVVWAFAPAPYGGPVS